MLQSFENSELNTSLTANSEAMPLVHAVSSGLLKQVHALQRKKATVIPTALLLSTVEICMLNVVFFLALNNIYLI